MHQFLETKELVVNSTVHFDRDFPAVKSSVLLNSKLLNAVLSKHTHIFPEGSCLDFIKALKIFSNVCCYG